MIMKSWCGLVAIVAGLSILGCQNYAFEELPSSVIKEKRWTKNIVISSAADILFVIDNSYSMAGEQRQLGDSFKIFTDKLEELVGTDYHIAVITTGMESPGCPSCSVISPACINETGENGRFQDRICHNEGDLIKPVYSCVTDQATCPRVIDSAHKHCFFDDSTKSGFALDGVEGCGYERGLAPIRIALDELVDRYNSDFLRKDASLTIVIISDEEDCGEVGDITDELPGIRADACYYASKKADPDGNANDPEGKLYKLTPVEDYYNFLMKLKNGREGMVKFAAVVGVKDVNDLSTTSIDYSYNGSRWVVDNACTTRDCEGDYCYAKPGTRYIQLAQLFHDNGFVDTICQDDFSKTWEYIATLVSCPRVFKLSEEILDPDLANILINDEAVPRYSCGYVDEVKLVECSGPDDDSCPGGLACIPTWNYAPPLDTPDPNAPAGTISFATHYDPCKFFEPGDNVHIELVYVTP
ncbi:MAG TPA: hypothetical protein VM425_02370 [Myxococcota bacterium]|nr:hypothetical protein [Myxococcota bacterium]